MLYNDWHTEEDRTDPIIEEFDFSHYTLLQAIDYVKGIKSDIEGVRPSTIKEYNATKATLVDFFMYAKIPQDLLLRNVNDVFLRKYFDYLKQERKSTNKTYNARRLMLHAVMNTLIKRDPKLFGGNNPIARVKFLKVESKGHTAYTDKQMMQIRDAIIKGGEAHLLFFIQFMYYTLARPKELRLLKVGDIDMDNKRILFRAEIAKTVIEQYVGINERLMKLIEENNILKYPPSYYIFSNCHGGAHLHTPGPTPVASSYFYKRITPYITALGFHKVNDNYTLYSFKHTGAIALYKATKDIKLIQAQCRHQSIEQTNIYLRDLGVLTDFDQLNRWNGPI
jgi:integrase